MRTFKSREEVDAWLSKSGWFPGRRCKEEAAAEIEILVEKYRTGGAHLEVVGPALDFIQEHVGVIAPAEKLAHDTGPYEAVSFNPRLVFDGDVEEVAELSDGLGVKLFPVAHDAYDGGTFLIDEKGRFFYLHHTGGYYLGEDKYSALLKYSQGDLQDAEDFYV